METSQPIVRMDRPPDNICLFRLSALGDATHTVPVVRALQTAWPRARLTWIIGKLEHRLLAGLEGVDFIVFDKRGGWPAVRELKQRLSSRRYDLLLHLQVALRANLLGRLVSAPVRLGWDKARSRDKHTWFTNHQVASVPFQHQVQGFLEFPRALGIDVPTPQWELPISEEDHAWAEQQLPGDQPTLLISPCSSHPLRNWLDERYAAVADEAAARGLRVVLSGGPSELERRTAENIQQAMQAPAINLVGKDTLTQLLALLARATVVLTPDSGPAHMASAVGTPVIGLHAATWSKRSGPYRSLNLCVDRYREAAEQFRGQAPEQLRWGHRIEEPGVMALIAVEPVLEMLDKALRPAPGPGAAPSPG